MSDSLDIKEGDLVRAFHPLKLGVIHHGTVVNISAHTVEIDYGIYGKWWTLKAHVTEILQRKG